MKKYSQVSKPNQKILLILILSFLVTPFNLVKADTPLDPNLILGLRQGHIGTCVPTVVQQLQSVGYRNVEAAARQYCECVGIFYFNDFTQSDYDEMMRSPTRALPGRIAANRLDIQEYCATIHFVGL